MSTSKNCNIDVAEELLSSDSLSNAESQGREGIKDQKEMAGEG